MHSYTTHSGDRYIIYQGRDDARKHPESADLWFFVPEGQFGEARGFQKAFHTAAETEAEVEAWDANYQPLNARFLELLHEEEVKERRSQLRLAKVS